MKALVVCFVVLSAAAFVALEALPASIEERDALVGKSNENNNSEDEYRKTLNQCRCMDIESQNKPRPVVHSDNSSSNGSNSTSHTPTFMCYTMAGIHKALYRNDSDNDSWTMPQKLYTRFHNNRSMNHPNKSQNATEMKAFFDFLETTPLLTAHLVNQSSKLSFNMTGAISCEMAAESSKNKFEVLEETSIMDVFDEYSNNTRPTLIIRRREIVYLDGHCLNKPVEEMTIDEFIEQYVRFKEVVDRLMESAQAVSKLNLFRQKEKSRKEGMKEAIQLLQEEWTLNAEQLENASDDESDKGMGTFGLFSFNPTD